MPRSAFIADALQEEEHPLIRIAAGLIKHRLLHDDDPLRTIRESDEHHSPGGRNHNAMISSILDESVLNCYRRSITETDFEQKSRWTDVFRKLEDGPGVHKKAMKYHCAIKNRALVKEYYRQLVYVRLKTWVHAAVCRATAPFVPELRNFRCFSYSGETTLEDPEATVAQMTKTSEPGAPFETWCKADITGTRRYRSGKERNEHLRANKSLYVVRYVGPTFGYDVAPSKDPEALSLMMRMAATLPGFSAEACKGVAEIITGEFLGKMARRRWASLFSDSEWFWGHGRVMSFPIELGKAIPTDPTETFSPIPEVPSPPKVDRTPPGFVYDRDTALQLITSVDCLREIVHMGALGSVSSTPADLKNIKKTVFRPDIINNNTEAQARTVLRKIKGLQKSKLKKGTRKRLQKYSDLVESDEVQWRFFVRLVQMLKLPENCTMADVY